MSGVLAMRKHALVQLKGMCVVAEQVIIDHGRPKPRGVRRTWIPTGCAFVPLCSEKLLPREVLAMNLPKIEGRVIDLVTRRMELD